MSSKRLSATKSQRQRTLVIDNVPAEATILFLDAFVALMRNPTLRAPPDRPPDAQRFQHLAHGYADPGKLMLLAPASAGNVAASDRLWITAAGLENPQPQTFRHRADGRLALQRFTNNRADKRRGGAVCLPGRTQIVGKRSATIHIASRV